MLSNDVFGVQLFLEGMDDSHSEKLCFWRSSGVVG